MTVHHRRELRAAAADILANTKHEKRLVLLWAGASALCSLLVGLISYLLDTGIAGTGGLSGIGLRSALTTAQQFLSTATTVALPFWTLGYQYTTLQISRKQHVTEASLLEGFRRFGPGLRLMLLLGALYGGIFTFCTYAVILALAMTPLAKPAYAIMEPIVAQMAADPTWLPDENTAVALTEAIMPMALCAGAVAGLVLLLLSYRLRLAQLRLMDEPRCGALEAINTSFRATKGNCMALFKLDLSFWWFWLVEILIMAVSYGDSILPMLGIALPVSPEVAFWVFYVAAMALQVAVYTAFHNRVSVTYALAYDALLPKPPAPEQSDI